LTALPDTEYRKRKFPSGPTKAPKRIAPKTYGIRDEISMFSNIVGRKLSVSFFVKFTNLVFPHMVKA
jgi:hypothetical protein